MLPDRSEIPRKETSPIEDPCDKNQKIQNFSQLQALSENFSNFQGRKKTQRLVSEGEKKHQGKFKASCFLKDKNLERNRHRSLSWTPYEDAILFQKYSELGSKWIQLSRHLPNKTDNNAKNRFYSLLKNLHKKLTQTQKQKKLHTRSPISYSSLLTILEIANFPLDFTDRRLAEVERNFNSLLAARDMIISVVQKLRQDFGQGVEELAEILVGLKYCLRFLNHRRVKRNGMRIPRSTQIGERQQRDRIMSQAAENDPTLNYISIEDLVKQLDRPPKTETSLIDECKSILESSIIDKETTIFF